MGEGRFKKKKKRAGRGRYKVVQRFKDSEWIGSGDRGGGGGIRMWRRGRVRMENINGVSGRGVSLKTSTFLLLLCILEQAAWRHCRK